MHKIVLRAFSAHKELRNEKREVCFANEFGLEIEQLQEVENEVEMASI